MTHKNVQSIRWLKTGTSCIKFHWWRNIRWQRAAVVNLVGHHCWQAYEDIETGSTSIRGKFHENPSMHMSLPTNINANIVESNVQLPGLEKWFRCGYLYLALQVALQLTQREFLLAGWHHGDVAHSRPALAIFRSYFAPGCLPKPSKTPRRCFDQLRNFYGS